MKGADGGSSKGLAHMDLANLSLRMAAAQVAPRGWSAGSSLNLCWRLIRKVGTKRLVAPTSSPPPAPSIYPILVSCERKEKEEI